MTTILASVKHGCMVSDSCTNDGDQKWPSNKVEVINEVFYGAAGSCADCEAFMKWARAGKKGRKPKIAPHEFWALELSKDGLTMWDEELTPYPAMRTFHAIGSGGKVATAAMLLGCTPEKAVELACEIDSNSGLPLQIHYLEGRAP